MDRFEKFSEPARKVLSLAQEEAQRFHHTYIGTEHLLLGMVREGEGVAAKVLASSGFELTKVRSAVEAIIGQGDRTVLGEMGLSSRLKKVVELAVEEARQLKNDRVDTEHLLLGLIREGEGIAAGIITKGGVTLDSVRARVMDTLRHGPGNSA
jgi:ATP-dependent Clp protease ATP-binding subunit ClpC